MRLGGMKPFRCQQCRTRFYLPSRLEEGIVAEHRWLRSVREEHSTDRDQRPR